MYEVFKQKALKYYNIEGYLVLYRFKKQDALELLNALKNNNEEIVGISLYIISNGEYDYGKPVGFFPGNNEIPTYITAEQYIKRIEDEDNLFFEITIKGDNLRPEKIDNAHLLNIDSTAKILDKPWVQCTNEDCLEAFKADDKEYIECPKCFKIYKNTFLEKNRV